MRLQDLLLRQTITLQIIWGEQKIEFPSEVIERSTNGIFVTAYIHQGKPLELNLAAGADVVCNVFANDPNNKMRVSWKNVEIKTVEKDGEIVYQLTTGGFNHMAKHDERRSHERIVIQKKGMLTAAGANYDIIVHDISDVGISFYISSKFVPESTQMTITFSDVIKDRQFSMKVGCVIVRSQEKAGNLIYGCRLIGELKDYLIYGFMKRLQIKNQ